MAPLTEDIRALDELITSSLALVAQFTSQTTPEPITISIDDLPNPLHVARDAAKLVKAHTTKISLLAINAPFTPTAVTKVLRELSSTCLPAMMSAVQICEHNKAAWSSLMSRELQLRVMRVFKEMETLLEEVRAVSRGNINTNRRDSLSCTGVVWESCDAVIELDKIGIAGLAVQKAEQYRDTIKDAIEELREWAEGEDPDTEGYDELLDEGDEGVDGDRGSLEDIFNAANSMPKDRPELRKLVDEAEAKLKKVVLLCTAVIKRRLKTFKGGPDGGQERAERLDGAMQSLRWIPHQVDELASCFYDLNDERVKEMLDKCVSEAKNVSTILQKNWEDAEEAEDTFTSWSKKWNDAVG